ncbi:MAG TPA: globin [Chthonomonadales bacterium]|nr:globin [Chthonomonadales bacterium]
MNRTSTPVPGTPASVFPQLGEAGIRRIVEAFYRRVEQDALLRPMYPEDLEGSRERFALFLIQFFGGPHSYSERRGNPMLRKRHLPFSIGQAERDAWLSHITAAIEEAHAPEPSRSTMLRYFHQASTFLINSPSP